MAYDGSTEFIISHMPNLYEKNNTRLHREPVASCTVAIVTMAAVLIWSLKR